TSSQVTKRPAGNDNKSVESNQSKEPTLIEQWKEHYNNRDFTTKPYHLHRMGVFSFFFCLLAVPVYCIIFVLPTLGLTAVQFAGFLFIILFVMAETFMNFMACINRHHDKDIVYCFHCNQPNQVVTAAASAKPTRMQEGWRACPHCQRDAPPRSHHCKICGECVLRRDHHCYFTSCCIGHHNQKHFLVMCVYSTIGLSMGICLTSINLTDQFQLPGNLFLPVTLWRLFSDYSYLVNVVLVLSVYLQIGCLGVTCVYFFLETVLVLRGQTFFEMGCNLRRYNLGVWDNMRVALGDSWYHWPLLLLYPIDSKQAADGAEWLITKHC
ncbi:hypothetical protein BOX15_Mlig020350g3, partial [Macrostomum lignano]